LRYLSLNASCTSLRPKLSPSLRASSMSVSMRSDPSRCTIPQTMSEDIV
jgi:hypothetical protein